MKSIDIVSKIVAREGEAKASPSKGIQSINLSDYLLKSVWDKVFEVRTDSQGAEYIFGKLPMVTQYGITMFSGEGVKVPSLASGLPFDGRTIWYNPDTQQIEVIGGTGGGSGEGVSNFWDLSGIPSWITNTKPKYTYTEIEGTPNLSVYATQSWVENKKYLTAITSAMVTSALGFTPFNSATFTKANIKSTLGISDWALASSKPSYTTSEVSEGTNLYFTNARAVSALTETLKSYVTLGGTQTITGEKNFTGGLKVNGSPIVYDSTKKYWKLEGDLLVTGGVTMYGSDSSFTPSTIMDAIAVDGTTISKSGGVLKVIGGTGGGVADSVAWANITGKPTWIGSNKPSYSYSEITGAISTTELQNYLTQNSYLNVTSGDNRYLQLSGGTITGSLEIKCGADNKIVINNTDGEGYSRIVFQENGSYIGQLLSTKDGNIHWGESKIWHSGNDGSGSGLDADLLDGRHANEFMSYIAAPTYVQANLINSELWSLAGGNGYIEYYDNGVWFNSRWGKVMAHYGFEGSLSGNASSATKLQTARTIWGQSFDGTGNVSGVISGVDGISFNSSNAINIDYNSNFVFKYTHLQDWSIQKQNTTKIFIVRNDGNVGINTDSPRCKFSITSVGTGSNPSLGALATVNTVGFGDNAYKTYFWTRGTGNGYIQVGREDGNTTAYNLILQALGGNVGIGTESPAYKLDVNGTLGVRGNLTIPTGYGYTLTCNNVQIPPNGDRITFNSLTGTYTKGILAMNTGNTYIQAPLSSDSSSGAQTPILIGWTNGVYATYIAPSGNVGIGTTSPSSKLHVSGDILATGAMTFYSMRKLKNVVDERGLSLNELSTIKPTRYTWKDGRDNRLHFGGIADDIQQVLPEVVYKTSEGLLTMDYGNAAFAVASSLINPVVDHENRIAILQERIVELEEEVERLKRA